LRANAAFVNGDVQKGLRDAFAFSFGRVRVPKRPRRQQDLGPEQE
jgi:hypothetical protein